MSTRTRPVTYSHDETSVEYVALSLDLDSVAAGTLECALLARGATPDAATTWTAPDALAGDLPFGALIGPPTSAAEFKHAGAGSYGLWCRTTAAPEVPVRLACYVVIT